jgi:hypothetical protein
MLITEKKKNKIMGFNDFNKLIQERFDYIQSNYKLFRSGITGDQLWNTYLKSFRPGDDPVFRDPESTSHTCNNDKNFIRRYGNVVGINENYEIVSMFDLDLDEFDVYYQPSKAISELLQNSKIENVFFETYEELNSLPYEKVNKSNKKFQLGNVTSYKQYTKEEVEKYGGVELNKVYAFDHFHVFLNTEFVDNSKKSIESIMGSYRDAKNVFKRAMDEIPLDTLELVRDLINQGSLLNGDTHLYKLNEFIPLKKEYNKIKNKDNWAWVKSYNLPIAKFRNELIGTLCVELAEGVELNDACKTWNKRVDPVNYMKAKSPITQKQIKEAQKFVEEMGYVESFNRRFATIDDININEILHSNVGKGEIKTASIFDSIQPSKSTRHKRSQFDCIEEVSIEKFMKDILPNCTSVEAFMENRFQGNLVSLIISNNKDVKSLFKWDNPFSWTYNGNLTGKSELAKMVESKGGRIDGVFRFTHSWNELEPNRSLMDLHVFMPNCGLHRDGLHDTYPSGDRVGWNRRNDVRSGGVQDVDYTNEAPVGYIPVENITFPTLDKMPEGKYICKIHNWSFRSSGGMGKAEIEFDGNIYEYVYPKTKHKEWITVAEVTLKDGKFTIEHKLPETNQSKKYWNLDTNEFHKVNLVCQSPNYWGENNTGNKHYFFMLDNCKSDVSLRSFHNEYLNADLLTHRKVMEVLANTTMIEPSDNQLAGIGFNSTVRDELIVKVSGSFKRTLKIKF